METVRKNLPADKDNFSMKVGNRIFTDKKEAGTAILAMCQEMDSLQQTVEIGEYAGMKMKVTFDSCGGRTEGEDGTVSGTGCPVKYG